RQTLPGGPMTQLGVHHADTLQAWLGPAVRVQGSTAHLAARVEIDDVSVAVLEYASGARSVIACSYVSPKTYRLRVYGTEANLDYRVDMSIWPQAERLDAATTLTLERAGGAEAVPFEPRDMLVDELQELARCVRDGARPETGAAEGIAALRVILGAVASAEEGRIVRAEEEVHVDRRSC
ncbi:MAG TPA: Gfo/Idh/MocA family oxidoreductase, partial [Actinomycetota bacterium]